MVREVVVKEAFGKELQSDGTSVVTLDGYDEIGRASCRERV